MLLSEQVHALFTIYMPKYMCIHGKAYSLYRFKKKKTVDEWFIATEHLIIKPDYSFVVTQKGPLRTPSVSIQCFKIEIAEENFFVGVPTSIILL